MTIPAFTGKSSAIHQVAAISIGRRHRQSPTYGNTLSRGDKMFKRMLLFGLITAFASASVAHPAPQSAAPSSQPSVSVPREVLERYVGRYALNGTIATVSLTDDGRLSIELAGQPKGPPLRAVGANEFVADAAGVRIFFEGDGPKTSRLRSQFAGSEVTGTRIADGSAAPGLQPAAPSSTLDAQDRREIVAKLSEALRQRYVFPDVGERTAAKLEAALAAGDYDGLSDPGAFALRLTSDAYAIAHDKHLRILTMLAPPSAPPVPMPPAESGIVRADKLAGGVGYLEAIGFPPLGLFKQAADRAMSSLAGSRALIIDIRRNGGGTPESVAYLSSFLVAPDVHLNDIVSRVANTNDFTRSSFRSVPTPVSFAGVPVYILASSHTFSGGEEFAYDLQAQKRAAIIGEVTGGGANPGGIVALTHGFNVGIPFGRAENPVTKTNWEGHGVQPDVQVPAQDALAVALERAGQKPIAEIGAASRQQVFMPQSAPPSSEPSVSVPREVLERYVGRYALNGTIATVSVTCDGRLNVEVAGQPKGPPMRAVSVNEFVVDAAGVHIFFDGDGPKASRLKSQYAGSEVSGARIADGVAVSAIKLPVDETLVPYANPADSVALPDGRKLHIVCMGKGSPTILLTAGAGDFAGSGWSTIQPEMARITRTCAWDRAGFGLSDGTMAAVTVASTTADLEAALASGGIPGPYVMVGHSLGSYESLLFTDRHPDKVVGMVLVDPSFPDQFERQRLGRPAPDTTKDPMAQRLRKCAADIRAGTAKADGPDPDGCFAYRLTWAPALRHAVIEKVGNPLQYEAMASFGENILVDGRQAINPSRNYRDMPLIVLTAGAMPTPTDDAQKALFAALTAGRDRGHAELAALSTRGRNMLVPGADHYIQRTKPQAVLDAVAKVVSEARASGSRAGRDQ